MEAQKILPDEDTFARLIHACGEGLRWQEALAIWDTTPPKAVMFSVCTMHAGDDCCAYSAKASIGFWNVSQLQTSPLN